MNKNITIFIPTYNNQTTIKIALTSLERQKITAISKVIIMDNGSSDKTVKIINNFQKKSRLPIKLVCNNRLKNLSKKCNWAISKTLTDYLIIMHADVRIVNTDAIKQYLDLMKIDSNVAATSYISHNRKYWEKYGFWQKCEFDRLISYPKLPGLTGKFDIFKVKALKKMGGFDTSKYHSAGEISDVELKLQKVGNIAISDNHYIHIHSLDKRYPLFNMIYRLARISEAQGVTLRNHYKEYKIQSFVVTFFREIMTSLLLAGGVATFYFHSYVYIFIVFLFWLIYSFIYTKNTFIYCLSNPRIIFLPLINIFLIFVSNYYFMRGLLTNKQNL